MSDLISRNNGDLAFRKYIKTKNRIYLFIAGTMTGFSIYGYFGNLNYIISATFISLISIYLLGLLISAANMSSDIPQAQKICTHFFPHRITGVILALLFILIMVTSWANIYFYSRNEFHNEIKTRLDSVYFSYITMVTIGYGDIAPNSDLTKKLVIGEISTSVLLFFGAIPLLVSRFHRLSYPTKTGESI